MPNASSFHEIALNARTHSGVEILIELIQSILGLTHTNRNRENQWETKRHCHGSLHHDRGQVIDKKEDESLVKRES